ncbi:MAG: hypothetical protein QOE82_1178 [Thermoanaerobaculia bacterium]|jgi:hypothetical protein|nr:hypothetical protein [Thermoanaerobaculia bacterium]
MRRVAVSALLFAYSMNAAAARLKVDPARRLEPVGSERMARVMRDAYAMFALPDGSKWIVHKVPAKREPGAMGVTRFGPDGAAHVFLLSDWLPKGTIPGGWCGQVYGVARFDDGRIGVSGGWTDGVNVHNAIFILGGRDHGAFDVEKLVELPSVRQLCAGPDDTILAITSDPGKRDGGPLLSLVRADGTVLPLGFLSAMPISAGDAAQRATKARISRYAERRFALYDPQIESVVLFDLRVAKGEAVLAGNNVIFIGDDPHDPALLGFDVRPDGDLVVIRTGTVSGATATHLAVYDGSGAAPALRKQTVITAHPWNFALPEAGGLRGVVFHDGVEFDTVEVEARH